MKCLFLALALSCSALASIAQDKGVIVRVKDGDTYVLKEGKDTFTIRLAGVDAPEMNQAFGLNAFYCVRDTILGKTLTVKTVDKDKYGRTVAYLFFEDGSSLSELLIARGWAWHYAQYDNDPKLEELMQKAVKNKLGLWACGAESVCPPWIYRGYNKRYRMLHCRGCAGVHSPLPVKK